MDRQSVDWRGYWPASPTPFAVDGEVDHAALARLMEHYVSAGVHGVLVNGSSGEWWAQSDDERIGVARTAVATVAGRIPVVVGCTAFTSRQVIALAAEAKAAGADGVLATPPPYAHPTQDEVVEHYRQIDAAIDLPLIAYNWPRGTAVEMTLDTLSRIADLDHVVAIKNSTGNLDLVLATLEKLSDRVRVFASLISPSGLGILRELGGDGYIDGGGVGAPYAVPFFEALWSGDLDTARAMAGKYAFLTRSWINPDFGGRFGSPSSQLKAAMNILGQPGGTVRQPFVPLQDAAALAELESLLNEAGIHA